MSKKNCKKCIHYRGKCILGKLVSEKSKNKEGKTCLFYIEAIEADWEF